MAFAMLSYADAEGQHEVLLDRDSTSMSGCRSARSVRVAPACDHPSR